MNNNSINKPELAPEHIAQLLSQAPLDDHTVAALRQARNLALDRQVQSVSVLSTGHGFNWLMPHSTQQKVAMVILFVTIIFGGVNYWQHAHEVELARLDAAILTDDMPLEVFVDNNTHTGQ